MAVVTKTVLKTYFEDGKEPDENKFIDLIDTMALVSGDEAAISARVDQGIDHDWWNEQGGYNSHFDGLTVSPLLWHSFRSHGGFSIPSGTTPDLTIGYSVAVLTYEQLVTKCFYSRYSTATLMRFLPHFHTISVPIKVGVRWDDGGNNNYNQLYWKVGSITPPRFDLVMEWRIGGGSVTSNVIHTQSTMDFPTIYVVVEGTQWTNWGTRPFMMGRTGGVVWMSGSSNHNWTPLHHGMFWDNGSGSYSPWQNAGFDAYGFV
jgi:hypothetical protein